ncbi:30S ribosomal protein S7 [candidate division WWE3 bacterium RIFCSPHIGHO2_12_FULL_38_15]|uniref:Small ribosomal subunit protein uS7 n=1 Tax=candidate division WWE3 bacterium RIFCSPHIGHO2_02_FULL_38_14 TaxID=1802620 RepID=A0A1F4VB38_UNCKA|nr:MAG: 30S ribosomal protein S7 [candidate division WWE3 bacterium RIFCSPHIGHO2_01_FULL_38_45]OGC49072.1 MAG: 30S ribosomal protein S7 [candidate division WWE3 bacterium RIFCSPHIGHO2_12_FULL_38_15]OGC53527.1 MAG: 30S ribosomal protein S7 [candidate division WWE3 bacterium RIFCSPLOWO2_01_FULL_37_24]OGC54431.1 MAG: 30S ribosomal protein S7 [candidate division WWE3 bacterium RIFCSPHIGHO2_02_FULL_38_14]HLB51676.1 30S ribosomal protein S7 [Patescibacteria group bacterium]
MRSGKTDKRQVQSDLLYKSRVVTRMINTVMLNGNKSLAEKIVYGALSKLAEERKDALTAFEQAVKNVMPVQEVRSRRIGGATYQVPVPLKHDRSEALAVRWIVQTARSRKGKPMLEKLFEEIKNAQSNTGSAIKKKEDTHRMAEANKAFAHFGKF